MHNCGSTTTISTKGTPHETRHPTIPGCRLVHWTNRIAKSSCDQIRFSYKLSSATERGKRRSSLCSNAASSSRAGTENTASTSASRNTRTSSATRSETLSIWSPISVRLLVCCAAGVAVGRLVAFAQVCPIHLRVQFLACHLPVRCSFDCDAFVGWSTTCAPITYLARASINEPR